MISEARAYRTTVVSDAKANAEYLTQLLPQYREYPELVLQRIYQDAVEEVLANAEEKFIMQRSEDGKPVGIPLSHESRSECGKTENKKRRTQKIEK